MTRNLIFCLYRLALAAILPFIVVYLLLRGLRDRRYFHSLLERFGWLPPSFVGTGGVSIWLHAVSVGEALSSIRLIERLRSEYPAATIFVSCTTLAGKAIAAEKLSRIADGVFYAPIDYCFAVRRVLRALRPSLVIILETEIWPNLYREVKRSGAGLLVVNARISDRAMPRYSALRSFLQPVMALPDAILAQNDLAAARFLEIGAPKDRLRVTGNLKYDFDPSRSRAPAVVLDLLRRTLPDPVWIAASTMSPARSGDIDEDDAVLDVFEKLAARRSRLLLILVPRRPERFDVAAGKLADRGIPFLRRSQLRGGDDLPLPAVLLLDSIGELSSLFSIATVVFMGGTLAERGGHNVLEPAFFGCPVIAGPHMENFSDIAKEFMAKGGLVRIGQAAELQAAVESLLNDSQYRAGIGERARGLAVAKRGATDQAVSEAGRLLDFSIRRPIRSLPARALLWPLSLLWGIGLLWKRALVRPKSLSAPVVSIGGIGMGGAGKTPFALHLAKALKDAGHRPAILTRGYRRARGESSTILAEGARAPVAITGDEPQLFLRDAVAPVGIGADRHATGRLLEARFRPGVILLDDGFQHWRLERCLDIVLIDALDPFAGEALAPLGRLREPLDALRRADAFLITRAIQGGPIAGIEARLRCINSQAPIFRSRVTPFQWVDFATGNTVPLQALSSRLGLAFCGLANPGSFWQSLAELDCHPLVRRTFGDHHKYHPSELGELAAHAKSAGCEMLLTTEKDSVNLPPETAALIDPQPLFFLRIGLEIENEPSFMALVAAKIRRPAS